MGVTLTKKSQAHSKFGRYHTMIWPPRTTFHWHTLVLIFHNFHNCTLNCMHETWIHTNFECVFPEWMGVTLTKEYQAHSKFDDLAAENCFSLTHTRFDFLIFHVAIHCCYNAGRNSLRRDHISVGWWSLLRPCWRQLVVTWFSMIQITKPLLQIHTSCITTDMGKMV